MQVQPPEVLDSAAGYFVGELYYDESGNTQVGHRYSDFFPTEAEADEFLANFS